MYCGEWSIVKRESDVVRAASLPCRCWNCPDCYEERKRQLIALAYAGRPNKFITLTVNPAFGRDKHHRAKLLREAWPALCKELVKKYGYKKPEYLCVFEATENGEPHLHILARVEYIDQAWLSAWMAKRIGAPIVDIRDCKSRRALANYVAKYIGKEPGRFEGVTRYSFTKGWEDRDRKEAALQRNRGEPWKVSTKSIHWIMTTWQMMGWRVWWEEGELCGQRERPT